MLLENRLSELSLIYGLLKATNYAFNLKRQRRQINIRNSRGQLCTKAENVTSSNCTFFLGVIVWTLTRRLN